MKRSESHSIVSDSLGPHGLYSPGNSLGQNTGGDSLSLPLGSSQTRDQTQVSHIAGRFFTSWVTWEALITNNPMEMLTYQKIFCLKYLKLGQYEQALLTWWSAANDIWAVFSRMLWLCFPTKTDTFSPSILLEYKSFRWLNLILWWHDRSLGIRSLKRCYFSEVAFKPSLMLSQQIQVL